MFFKECRLMELESALWDTEIAFIFSLIVDNKYTFKKIQIFVALTQWTDQPNKISLSKFIKQEVVRAKLDAIFD